MAGAEADMAFWICCTIACVSAAIAAMADELRLAALFLWVCGLGVGGVYISLGAEYLAVVQWTISTLVGIGFVLYSLLFGEDRERKEWIRVAPAFVVGLGFIIAVSFVAGDVRGRIQPVGPTITAADVGRALMSDDFVSLIILSLTLLLAVIGAGVISRPDTGD